MYSILVTDTTNDVSQTQATITEVTVNQIQSSVTPLNDNFFNSDQSAIIGDQMQDQSFITYLKRLMGMLSNRKNKRRFQKQVINLVNNEIDNV